MVRKHSIALVGAVLAVALAAAGCVPPPEQTPQEAVASIVEQVEQIRGHEFVTDPVVQFVDPSTFEADVLASLAAEEPDIAPDETAFVALDWLDGSQDLITEYRKTYGGGVVGYYDPTDGTLKVRGTKITPYRREVIAHELTHALDDQIFDLSDLDSASMHRFGAAERAGRRRTGLRGRSMLWVGVGGCGGALKLVSWRLGCQRCGGFCGAPAAGSQFSLKVLAVPGGL